MSGISCDFRCGESGKAVACHRQQAEKHRNYAVLGVFGCVSSAYTLPPSNGRQLYKKGQKPQRKGRWSAKTDRYYKDGKAQEFSLSWERRSKDEPPKKSAVQKNGEKLGIDNDPTIMRKYVARITADTATKNYAMALMGFSMVTAT